MKCAECKREIADGNLSCPACGAPVIAQPWVEGGPPASSAEDVAKWFPYASGALTQALSEAPAWEGLAARTKSRRAPLVLTAVALGVLAAMVVGVQLAYSSWEHRPWTRQLTYSQLRPGDCLTGSNLGLGSGKAWPYAVTQVPCTQRHLAEITFVGNLWPTSLTTFPGENAVTNTVDDRCQSVIYTYAALQYQAALTYDSIAPYGGSDWGSGDRQVVCMVYEQGTPLFHSVKATR